MVLYVVETLLGSSILTVRIALRPARGCEARTRMRGSARPLRLLFQMVLPFSLVPGVLLLGYAAIDVQQGRLVADVDGYLERARWMAIMLLGGAVLDSLLAPVRTVDMARVRGGVAGEPHVGARDRASWSARRSCSGAATRRPTSGPGSALRLFSDVNALRPSERERLRLHFLGPGRHRCLS